MSKLAQIRRGMRYTNKMQYWCEPYAYANFRQNVNINVSSQNKDCYQRITLQDFHNWERNESIFFFETNSTKEMASLMSRYVPCGRVNDKIGPNTR